MAAQTLFLRSTQSAVVTSTTTCKLLSATQGAGITSGTSVREAKTLATFQFVPGTTLNTTSFTTGTTPNTKGFLFDNSIPGVYASGTWTVKGELIGTSASGTCALKASLWVVTATTTTVTSVSQVANAAASTTFTPSTSATAISLTFSPGAVTLAANQYLYLELYLTQSVAGSSTTGTITLDLDDSGVNASSVTTPSFAAQPQFTASITPSGALAKKAARSLSASLSLFASSFKPTSIGGCCLWLDGADTSTITVATGVSQWNDKSGNGNNVVQATGASQPTQTTLNGLNALSFNGSEALAAASTTGTPNGSGAKWSAFVVATCASSTGFPVALGLGVASGTGLLAVFVWQGGGWAISDSAANVFAAGAIGTAAHLVADTYSGGDIGVNTAQYLDGTVQTPSTSGTPSTQSLAANPPLSIGAQAGGGQGWSGTIAEVVFYNSALSAADRQRIEGYLAWKWGLQASLPGGHPYANAAPNAFTRVVQRAYTAGLTSSGAFVKSSLRSLSAKLFPTSAGVGIVSGCVLWLDGSDTSTITQSSGSVSQWNDKSGSGNNVSQTTGANQPTQTTLGGKNALVFGASVSVALKNTSASFPAGSTSLFIVNQFSNNSVNYPTLFTGSDGSTQCPWLGFQGQFSSTWWAAPPPSGAFAGSPLGSPNTPIIYEVIWTDGVGTNLYLTGTANGTKPAASGADVLGSYSQVAIGNSVIQNNGANAVIAEVVVFSGALTTLQRQFIEGYLAWKWGLQASLPGGHPYANAAPVGGFTRVVQRAYTAALTFAGSSTRLVQRAFTAALTFVGALTGLKSGIQYTQALTAALSSAAALIRTTSRGLTASITPAGALARSIRRAFTAGLTPTAALARTAQRAFTAALTSSAAFVASARHSVVFTAAVTSSGVLARSVQRALTAALPTSAALARTTQRAFTAAVTPTATIARAVARSLTAALSSAGVVARRTAKTSTAGLTFAGAVVKQALLPFTATEGPSGTITRSIARALTAGLSSAGSTARSKERGLTAALAPAGSLVRSTARAFTAAVASAGALTGALLTGARQYTQTLAAGLTTSGVVARTTNRALTAAVATGGVLGRLIARSLTAATTPTATFVRRTNRAFTAAVASSGALARSISRSFAAAIVPGGALAPVFEAASHAYTQVLAASVSFVGTIARSTNRSMSGAISPGATISRNVSKVFTAALVSSGTIRRGIARAFAAVVAFVAAVSSILPLRRPPQHLGFVRFQTNATVEEVFFARTFHAHAQFQAAVRFNAVAFARTLNVPVQFEPSIAYPMLNFSRT